MEKKESFEWDIKGEVVMVVVVVVGGGGGGGGGEGRPLMHVLQANAVLLGPLTDRQTDDKHA